MCYIGPDAKSKAIAQGTAALASEAKRIGAKTKQEIESYIAEHDKELN
jgi:hypothetical protein